METTTITKDELELIQSMTAKFNRAKMAIGEIEMDKMNVLRAIEEMRSEFAVNEKILIEKYGADAVINVQTGEITRKQQ